MNLHQTTTKTIAGAKTNTSDIPVMSFTAPVNITALNH